MLRAFYGTLILCGIGLVSCDYDKEVIEPIPELTLCDTISPTYVTDIEPIINQSCAIAGCHTATNGNGIPYTNYEQVKEKVDSGKFRKKVIEDKTMPKIGSLTEDQLQLIECWLDAGAPKE